MLRCQPGRESAALALLLAGRCEPGGRPWTAPPGGRTPAACSGRWTLAALAQMAGHAAEDRRVGSLDALRAEERSAVLLGCGFAETERPDLVAGLAALLAEATGSRFLAMLGGAELAGRPPRRSTPAGFPGRAGYTAPEMLEAAVHRRPEGPPGPRLRPAAAPPRAACPTSRGGEAPVPRGDRAAPRARPRTRAHVVLAVGAPGARRPGTVVDAFGARDGPGARRYRRPGPPARDGDILGARRRLARLAARRRRPPPAAAPPGPRRGLLRRAGAPLPARAALARRPRGRAPTCSSADSPRPTPRTGGSRATSPGRATRCPPPRVAISPAPRRGARRPGGRARAAAQPRRRKRVLEVRIEQSLPGRRGARPPPLARGPRGSCAGGSTRCSATST